MLSSLFEVRRSLNVILGEPRMPDTLNSYEWSMIKEYSNSLKIFKEATVIMTMDKIPTLPNYIPTIYGLRHTLIDLIRKDNKCPTLNPKNNLLAELNNRFNFIEDCELLVISMIMDLRVKDRLLSAERKTTAQSLLHSFATEYLDTSDMHGTTPPQTRQSHRHRELSLNFTII